MLFDFLRFVVAIMAFGMGFILVDMMRPRLADVSRSRNDFSGIVSVLNTIVLVLLFPQMSFVLTYFVLLCCYSIGSVHLDRITHRWDVEFAKPKDFLSVAKLVGVLLAVALFVVWMEGRPLLDLFSNSFWFEMMSHRRY
jgi:hypothetical protein